MRIYIKKTGKSSFLILKEKVWQSILSDLMTMFVLIGLIAADIVFSILVTHSFVIDALVVVLVVAYIMGWTKSKKEEISKEELKEIIDEL